MKVQVNGKLPTSAFKELTDELKERVGQLTETLDENNSITIGLHKDAQDYSKIEHGKDLKKDETTSVVMIGAIHEFGLGVQPVRPWLSASFKEDIRLLKTKMQIALSWWAKDPETIRKEFEEIGKFGAESVKNHIFRNDIGLEANKESTAKRKGGNTPMVDTKHMIQQVDYKVGKDLAK